MAVNAKDEAMPYIGGDGSDTAATPVSDAPLRVAHDVRCGSVKGMSQDEAAQRRFRHGSCRANAPVIGGYREGCNGRENRRRHAAAFPSFAKLGLGRRKPAVFVVGGTACLPPLRGGANDSNIFWNNITRCKRGRQSRESLNKPRRIYSKIHALNMPTVIDQYRAFVKERGGFFGI